MKGYWLRFRSNAFLTTCLLLVLTAVDPSHVDAQPKISTNSGSVAPGSTITATWSGISSPRPLDWVGLYRPGTANTAYIDWIYVSCSKSGSSPKPSGSCPFPLPTSLAPGTYEVRILANDGFTSLANSNAFTVGAGAAPPPLGNVFYISPDGFDSNQGSSSQPWKTWAHALKRLSPGDTLIAKNGTYGYANGNGYPNINCANGYKMGTSSRPIAIKAENERQAFIDNDGKVAGNSFMISNCSHWQIEGLRIKNDDFDDGSLDYGSVVAVMNSSDITLRRLLLYKNNRYRNSHVLSFSGVNSLIEETELYWFHRHGVLIRGDANIVRRNYVNSRFVTDLKNASTSSPPYKSVAWQWGDSCYINYPGAKNIFENNICENAGAAFETIAASSTSDGNKFLGNLAINVGSGALIVPQTPFTGTYPTNNYLENHVVIGATQGFGIGGYSINTQCANCSFIGNKWGVLVRKNSDWPWTQDASFTCTNCLAMNNGAGFVIYDHWIWEIESAWRTTTVQTFIRARLTGISSEKPSRILEWERARPSFRLIVRCITPERTQRVLGPTCFIDTRMESSFPHLLTAGFGIPPRELSEALVLWLRELNDISGTSLFDVHTRLNV